MKAMTKYQLEHFKRKAQDKFEPLIDEANLTLRKTVADMTASAEKKLAQKLNISADIEEIFNFLGQLLIGGWSFIGTL